MKLTTTNKRTLKLLSRGGIDPLRLDRRPLGEILQDEIPHARWRRERKTIKRMGYRDWQHLLRERLKR